MTSARLYPAGTGNATSAIEDCPCGWRGPLAGLPHCSECGKHHPLDRKHATNLCANGCGRSRHRVKGHHDACNLCFECCTERHGGPPGPEIAKNQAPAFLAKSQELAALVNPEVNTTWLDVRTAYVASRRNPEISYRVDIAIDGSTVCSCPGFEHHGHCWHAKFVREEMTATYREETAIVPLAVNPPKAVLPSADVLVSIRETAAMAVGGAVALPEGVRTKEQAAAIMLYGWELGIPPMTALQELYIVKGKVSPSAKVMAGLVKNREPDSELRIVELTDQKCTLRFIRPTKKVNAEYTVTWADIQKANLAGGNNASYPKDRLMYHCMKRIYRIFAPDLIFNLGSSMVAAALTTDDADEADFIEAQGFTVDRDTGEIVDPEPVGGGDVVIQEGEHDVIPGATELISSQQLNTIKALVGTKWAPGQTLDQVAEHLRLDRPALTSIEGLTEKQGADAIEWLKSEPWKK